MLWFSSRLTDRIGEMAAASFVVRFLQLFWQFSQCYGTYQSLPPSKRRAWVQRYERDRSTRKPCS